MRPGKLAVLVLEEEPALALVRVERPSLVGSTDIELPGSTCWQGAPNRSSLLAVGVSRWGWSARGRQEERGEVKGSGGGQPRQRVLSLRWKKPCFLPRPQPELDCELTLHNLHNVSHCCLHEDITSNDSVY